MVKLPVTFHSLSVKIYVVVDLIDCPPPPQQTNARIRVRR